MISSGRTCNDCHEWKPAQEFHRNRANKDGLTPYCRTCWKHRNKAQYTQHREKRVVWMRAYRGDLKKQVVDAYGGCCACCGEAKIEFLTIDHVNNDGAAHRRELGVSGGPILHRHIIERGFPADFQILCWNCNGAKGVYGRCPHQAEVLSGSQ